jgi:hypothetical protein
VGHTVTLPKVLSKEPYLSLGYQHEHYWNAGYYAHDDGIEGQCKDTGPAWVELSIQHPKPK